MCALNLGKRFSAKGTDLLYCSANAELRCDNYMGYKDGVCNISGKQYDYQQQDVAWNAPNIGSTPTTTTTVVASAAGRKRKRPPKQEAIMAKIEALFDNLLLSKHRQESNEKKRAANQRECKRMCAAYMNRPKGPGQYATVQGVIAIEDYYNNKPLPYRTVELQPSRKQYYVGLVLQIWEKVAAYAASAGENVSVDVVILAIVYTLRTGLRHQGNVLIPKDPLLSMEGVLPVITDLKRFNCKSKDITTGEKLIAETFSPKATKMIPREKLVLNLQHIDPVQTLQRDGQDATVFYKPKDKRIRTETPIT